MMSDYQEPVVLPPDDASVQYPIPWPEYVPPQGSEVIPPVLPGEESDAASKESDD